MELQKIFKLSFRRRAVLHIFLIDLANGEHGLSPVLAARILLHQKLVFFYGILRSLRIVEGPPFLRQQLGRSHNAGICPAGVGGDQIDLVIGLDRAHIITAGAIALRASVKRLSHFFCSLELGQGQDFFLGQGAGRGRRRERRG